MAQKLVLDEAAMQEDFFSDTALIGIVSPLPAYQLCWMLNEHFDMNFARESELDVCVQNKKDTAERYYPVYQYCVPLNGARYLLYKLKSDKQSLLPEAKGIDYLWMIQGSAPETHAQNITKHLKKMPSVQLAQQLQPGSLKSLGNLIV